MKLSKVQEKAIILMKNGWELGRYTRWGGGSYFILQKDGLGKGGETILIRQYRTGYALIKKGLIKSVGGYNPERYVLCDIPTSGETPT